MDTINTIGRRKTSVARLYMQPGKGEFTVNGESLDNYFQNDVLKIIVKQPLVLVQQDGNFDFKVNVDGGGLSGQAEAVRMAISRALCEMVERKKYGKRKARRSFQFSKR